LVEKTVLSLSAAIALPLTVWRLASFKSDLNKECTEQNDKRFKRTGGGIIDKCNLNKSLQVGIESSLESGKRC
jgi:hypothetical protein